MRSDPAGRAGRSAAEGYAIARGAARRRRVVQLGALGIGALCVIVGPSLSWQVAGVAAVLLVTWRARPVADSARWLRGAAGEVATAVLLEGLPARRWVVLHDRAIPGSAANLDHVVIGPSGVWVVDSKAFRAPLRAGWRSVRAGEHRVDTRPAVWAASVVADRLDVDVRPLLAVHGEGLPRRGRRVGGVPVLPAGSVVGRLRRRRGSARLRRADVAALGAECDRIFPPALARPSTTARTQIPVMRP